MDLFCRDRIAVISYIFNARLGIIAAIITITNKNIINKIIHSGISPEAPSLINMIIDNLTAPIQRTSDFPKNLFFSHSDIDLAIGKPWNSGTSGKD